MNYAYIDSRHDELCRCEGCRPQPLEHRETCGCAECVTDYSACGQSEPFGFNVSVKWELGRPVEAEWFAPDDGIEVSAASSAEMDALVARIAGRRFKDADDLVRYLRQVTGTRDFD